MSRTLKDRPFWVQTNDITDPTRYIWHDHLDAGKPVYQNKKVTDDNGDVVYITTEHTSTRHLITFTNGEQTSAFIPHRYYGNENVISITPYQHSYTHTRIKTERVLVGHLPEECTAHIPVTRSAACSYGGVNTTHICVPQLDRTNYNRPRKTDRKSHHAAARNTERMNTRKMMNDWNNNQDINDLDQDAATTRQQRHNGWWT